MELTEGTSVTSGAITPLGEKALTAVATMPRPSTTTDTAAPRRP